MRPLIVALMTFVFAACEADPAKIPDADTTGPSDADGVDDAAPDSDVAEVEVVEKPGLGIDYGTTEPGARPRFDLAAEDWMSVGWPSDRYREGGRIKLTNMPRGVAVLIETFIAFGEEVLDGFGLNGAIYVELDGALDVKTLPSTTDSMQPDSVIQLVNTTPGARFGERMPLLFKFYGDDGVDPIYRKKTLAMRPVYGFVLAEGQTYCAIVTRAAKDADGRYLQQAQGFAEALGTQSFLSSLVSYLETSPLAVKDIATATCFTTQNATRELNQVARYIDDAVPPAVEIIYEPNVFGEFHGLYTAPNFQAGEKPYQEDGDIRFDEAGDPIPQADEELRFLLLTPTDMPMPEDGWPVTLYAHGTGGDYESCRSDTRELVIDGVAVLCIDQPLHGPRGPGRELDETELILYSFNFINPPAGRSAFRQAAIDTIWLSRMIEADRFALPANETRAGRELKLNPDRILFYGHSHGGLSGTLALAVDPRIKAGVISGMSGVIIETILRRKDPVDLAGLAATVLGIAPTELDTFHPALNLLQMLVDATDPITYTPMWLSPPPGVPPKHVFVTEGTLDAASPSVGTDAATAAGRVPQVRPLAKLSEAHVLKGIEPVDLPLKGNVDLGNGVTRTVGLRQWQGGSHFVAFNAADARAMWRRFLVSAAYEDVPELSTGTVVVTQPTPTAAADLCATAKEIDVTRGFPIEVRGNTQVAGAEFTASGCVGATDDVGAAGRDVFYRFTPPADGSYRFRIALQPAIDRDTPRFGPDLVAVLEGCGGTCLGRRVGGNLDLDLDAGTSVVIAVDGESWLDVGAYSLIVEQRCAVLECGDRECGTYGCGTCGTCSNTTICSAEGKCEPRLEGDTCAEPIVADAVPFSWSGDTRLYANDAFYASASCPDFPFGFGVASSDAVVRFTPPTSGPFIAKVDADFDVNVWASTTCEAPGNACVAANRTGGRKAQIRLDGVAGQPLFVFVDGASNTGNSAGHATLAITACEPDCDGRACGDDGCGGSCGACPNDESCVVTPGTCVIPYECPATTVCQAIDGDRCESALAVGELPWTDSRNSTAFKNDYGFGAHWCPLQPDGSGTRESRGFGAGDVAYAFTAPRAGLYRFGLDTGAPPNVFDAAIYLASDCNDLEATCLAADDRDRNDRVWAQLAADQQVFAIVDGWTNFSNLAGNYKLDVRECIASCQDRVCGSDGCIGSCGTCGAGTTCQSGQCRLPVGTECTNPRGVGTLPWSETLDTTSYGADRESSCEGAPAGALSADLTYRFTAPKNGIFRFALSSSLSLQLYLEDACANGTCWATAPAGSSVDVTMTKDQVIFATVDGVDVGGAEPAGVAGSFTLSVREACNPSCEGKDCGADGCGGTCGSCAVPADVCTAEQLCIDPTVAVGNTCGNAFSVGALPFLGSGDTSAATNDYILDEGQCGGLTSKGMGSRDEVWRFTAPTAGRYMIEVVPSGWDAALYVVKDCADMVGTCVGGDDGETVERTVVNLSAGESVSIVVDGEDNIFDDAGPYELRVLAITGSR